MRNRVGFFRDRRGAVAVVCALTLPVLAAFAAFAIDVGYMMSLQARLQATADAAVLAAATAGNVPSQAQNLAMDYASKNMSVGEHGYVLTPSDVVVGNWNAVTHTFTPAGAGVCINAVRVITRRAEVNGNPAELFFARILGFYDTDITTDAVATFGALCVGQGATRFLIDDEMIDTDIPAIEDLADRLGVTPDDIVNDNDGDWFIDMPPGEEIELPTGQIGDEALFDMNHPEWPFNDYSDPSHVDFLNYNEDSSSWRYDLVPKAMLDPLVGVSSVSDASEYPFYVDPDFVHISPVFVSDVNALNPVNGAPAVNALGLRRGLLAFRIIGVGADPDGDGSVLPNLIIEIVDPTTIDLDFVQPFFDEGGVVALETPQLVQ